MCQVDRLTAPRVAMPGPPLSTPCHAATNGALPRPGRSGSQQRSWSSRALASTRRVRMTTTTATFRGCPSATS